MVSNTKSYKTSDYDFDYDFDSFTVSDFMMINNTRLIRFIFNNIINMM
jgi:hypothetical protein